MPRYLAPLVLALLIGGCATGDAIQPPEASGLVGVRPYPTPTDVCQVIGESAASREYLDDAALLVGCPASEQGALADRVAEGGRVVAQVGAWVLVSIPQR